MPLHIVHDDITRMTVDAIVNAANGLMLGGGGVDGCIHQAAGLKMTIECCMVGGCEVGGARLTGAGRLPCRYIIHVVGPRYRGGRHGEREKLVCCYRRALWLAREMRCRSIAFPLISAGGLGYPEEEALAVAQETISEFLRWQDMTVYMVLYKRS